MEWISSTLSLGIGGTTQKYVPPEAKAEVALSCGVERLSTNSRYEIIYEVMIGQHHVRRRYGHFVGLHEALKSELGGHSLTSTSLPEAAPKRTLEELARGRAGEGTTRVIRQRSMRLQVYLQAVLSVAAASEAMREFLDPDLGPWDAAADDIDEESEEDDPEEQGLDAEVAASVREQRLALKKARDEVKSLTREREQLDDASEGDPRLAKLSMQVSSASEGTKCAIQHRERMQVRISQELKIKSSQSEKLQTILQKRDASYKTIEAELSSEIIRLDEASAKARELRAEGTEADRIRLEEVRTRAREARRQAAIAGALFEAQAATAQALEVQVRDLASSEAGTRLDRETRQKRAQDLRAKAEKSMETDFFQVCGWQGSEAEAIDTEAMTAAAECDARAEATELRLDELRRLRRLWIAHDTSRKEMVAHAVTDQAANLRDGILRQLGTQLGAQEQVVREEDCKRLASAGVLAADAIFAKRLDAMRRRREGMDDALDALDAAEDAAREAEADAIAIDLAYAECQAALDQASGQLFIASDARDAALAVRSAFIANAEDLESEALRLDTETRHADRDRRAACLAAQRAADEARAEPTTMLALLIAAPRFVRIAQATTNGLFEDDDEEPLFPADLVDRLATDLLRKDLLNLGSPDSGGVIDLDAIASSRAPSPPPESPEENNQEAELELPAVFTRALESAMNSEQQCQANESNLKNQFTEATTRVDQQRTEIDSKIKLAKQRVLAAEHAITRLTAYGTTRAATPPPPQTSENKEDNGETALPEEAPASTTGNLTDVHRPLHDEELEESI